MSDTPTIEEAVEQASASLSGEAVSDAPVEETPAQPEVTEETLQAPEEVTESPKETPLDKFDPQKLPPELQSVYKDLQKGFTQGRQKDREEVNQLRNQLIEYQAKLDALSRGEVPQERALSPEEYIAKVADRVVTEKSVNAFRDQALKDYNSFDPRLTKPEDGQESETYDPTMDAVIGAQMDKALQDHIDANGSELGFDHKSQLKELVSNWDAYKQREINAFLEKQKKMAKQSEGKLSKFSPKATTNDTTPTANMSIEDAVKYAFQKQGK